MTLHFWFEKPSEDVHYVHGHIETLYAMYDPGCPPDPEKQLHTTQVEFLEYSLLKQGFKVIMHPITSTLREPFEIVLGKNDTTEREIRTSHNLLKLILAEEFGDVT